MANPESIKDLLAGLDENQLRRLLTDVLNSHPHLTDWVETRIITQSVKAAGHAEPAEETTQPVRLPAPPIDSAPFKRQARQLMRSPYEYGVSWGIASGISELLDQAQPFLEAGDGRNALLVLEAITQPYVESWFEYDDSDGDLGEVFSSIGPLFAEAILSAGLSPDEREAWADKLTDWQGEIDDYGIDEGFDVAIAAARQGWDFPPLVKVLQKGYVSEQGAWEDEAPWYTDKLAIARLNVLERQGRTTEYLYLAEAEGQTALYLTMLVKLGRIDEAVENSLKYLATIDEALAVAQTFREYNQPAEAIRIAEHGLSLQGHTLSMLARWLRDFAGEIAQRDVALNAAQIAFRETNSLEDYQAVESLAGAGWPEIKPALLNQLAGARYALAGIDVYLHEGMIDEATKAIDRSGYAGYHVVEKVVDAAWQSHPDWAIVQCKKQAEPIMDNGQSKYYHHAARWLEKAGKAYQAANRNEEWKSYLDSLIGKHARKYSLRPRLEELRK